MANTHRASLFVTCLVDQIYPEVGESTVRLLRHLGVEVDSPSAQTCCGQPAFNSGYRGHAKALARRFLAAFSRSDYVVAPSGSCASMVRVHYPELLADEPDSARLADSVGSRVYELSEFIVDILGVEAVPGSGASSGPIVATYHEGCHLRRELGVSDQPRRLLAAAPGVSLVEMDQVEVCCGFGGTFALKYADISAAIMEDKLDRIAATGADTLVSCESGCLMHLSGGMKRRGMPVTPMHISQVLDRSLRQPGGP